jgi:hypothetical protein
MDGKKESAKNYEVMVEDNYKQPSLDEDDRYCLGKFETYEKAVKACKEFLDRDLKDILKDCKNEEDFSEYWCFHGETLYITPSEGDDFNSREYVDQKVSEYFKK